MPVKELQLDDLCLEICELNAIGMVNLLKHATRLRSLRFSKLVNIWDGWDDEGHERGEKGRWLDMIRAIEKSGLQDRLETLELTSHSKHCTIAGLEQPLDFSAFDSLNDLTLDAHTSVKGLPDSLRSLTFVRPKDFPGACLPPLEDRLREVRRCSLPRDVQRKVTFKIPDRSRGYESLRVMADAWASIGFEPSIEANA